jgi:FMN-dependent NADH-azoreductase
VNESPDDFDEHRRRPVTVPTFFRLDASIRAEGSVSRALADEVEQVWRREYPGHELIRRDLGLHPLPPIWPDAVGDGTGTREAREATALAAELVDEILAADAYVFAVPMYNFGVPHQVKQWIDMIITDPRAADVNQPLLPGRPAVLVEARGGGYGPGTRREGWNHSTPYLERILVDVWGLDLAVVAAELTQAHANPAMAHLTELAQQMRVDARATAIEHAVRAARQLRAAA